MSAKEKESNTPMRQARHRAGISVEELAKRSGVTNATIRSWELRGGGMMLEPAMAVAAALGISVEEYARGKKE